MHYNSTFFVVFSTNIVEHSAIFVVFSCKYSRKKRLYSRQQLYLKMTHSSETEIFFGIVRMESCSSGCTGDMPCWRKSRFQNKKIDFLPQISKFLGQNCTFSSLEANWSRTGQCFQHEKSASFVPWYEGTKIITPSPQKMDFWHFLPNIDIFGPFDPMPDQNTMRTSHLGGFSIMWVSKLLFTPKDIKILGPKTAKFGLSFSSCLLRSKDPRILGS